MASPRGESMRTPILIALFSFLTIAACSSETAGPPAKNDELLAPPAPGTGVQFRMTSTVAPGQEIERCKLVKVPPEGLFVTRDELRFSQGSHHVLLYRTPYTEIPATTRDGTPINGAEVHDCNDGAPRSWKVNGIVAGSQSSEGGSFLGSLPTGVALTVEPGTVLVMNTHYLNASTESLEVDARINLHTMPPEQVKVEAGIIFHYNDFIRIPANGTSSARMRCVTPRDISLVRLQSHMHRRGVGSVANVVSADGSTQEVYTSSSWEDVPVRDFAPVLPIKAGQALDFRCDYVNTEARDVMQGLTTRDEMCVLLGAYFPRDPLVEGCRDEEGFSAETWVGSGSATCADTLACAFSAKDPDEDGGNELFGCIVNGCPGVAEEISSAYHCYRSGGRGACDSACEKDADSCALCTEAACKPVVDACQAAKCGP
jgi:hypothetical protein